VGVGCGVNIYVSGRTDGNLASPNAGGWDSWVAKYNTNGNLLWIKQFGTGGDDSAHSIATDSKGNVYLTGWTDGDLGSPNAGSWDAWVAKYDTNGNLLWTNQLGTPSADTTYDGVDTDSLGNVYAGWTNGDLGGKSAGGLDAWVAKYNTKGYLFWTEQLGTSSSGTSYDIENTGESRVYHPYFELPC
jgi:hypothetical protein